MNKARIANIDGLTKPEIDYLCEHDYIKVGDKYYISKERASELVAQLQANVAEQRDSNCNIPLVSNKRELLIAFLKWRRGEILGDYTITEIDTFLEEQSEK